jgi:hypothetical protein
MILVTLMMEALRSFVTSLLTRATQRNIPEHSILHSRRRGNLKSYIKYYFEVTDDIGSKLFHRNHQQRPDLGKLLRLRTSLPLPSPSSPLSFTYSHTLHVPA